VRGAEAFRAHDATYPACRNAEALRSFVDERAEARIERTTRDALNRLLLCPLCAPRWIEGRPQSQCRERKQWSFDGGATLPERRSALCENVREFSHNLVPFKVGPMNGREARESDLWLKA